MKAAGSSAVDHYARLHATSPPVTAPAVRTAALARFVELGFPNQRDEAWKYTSLRRLEARRFERAVRADGDHEITVSALEGRCVTVVNGYVGQSIAGASAAQPSGAAALPRGLQVRSLAEALAAGTAAEPVLEVVAAGGAARFGMLNTALGDDGALVSVDDGADLAEPLHIRFANAGARSLVTLPRLRVALGRGARLRLIVEHVEDGAVEHFTASVLDVRLAEGAQLAMYRLQRLGTKTQLIETLDVDLARDARFRLHDASLGAALSRLDLNVSLSAPGADAALHGVFLADAQRHHDLQVRVDHRAPRTRSEQVFRGIAAGQGRGIVLAKAVVHVDAQQSDARQSLRNLLLSPGAEIDAKPDLEIYADDVKCSHGATVGQLDPAALFYLRTRGLDELEARRALTRAFAAAVLVRTGVASFERTVHALLDERLATLLENPA